MHLSIKLFLTGWRGYSGFCETPSVRRNLDSWLRRRLRLVFWRQWQRGRTRFAELRQRGGQPRFSRKNVQ